MQIVASDHGEQSAEQQKHNAVYAQDKSNNYPMFSWDKYRILKESWQRRSSSSRVHPSLAAASLAR